MNTVSYNLTPVYTNILNSRIVQRFACNRASAAHRFFVILQPADY